MSHVLDDFLWIALNRHGTLKKLKWFKELCWILSIPIVEHKTEWGTTLVLGIELDIIKMEVCLPGDKLKRCLCLLKKIQRIHEDDDESTGVTNRPIELRIVCDFPRKAVPTQNVFSVG